MKIALDEIVIPLLAVGLAEMGDKTQLSILLLSSRTREYFQLLLGVMLAFLLTDGIAIMVGSWVTDVIPMHLVKIASGLVFILFGILILKGDKDDDLVESNLSSKRAFASGFSMIFLSEWGDKTQIASALFATEYDPKMVFIGVMIALLLLSVMAIFLGKFISSRINRRAITRVGGVLFLLIGLSFLLYDYAPSVIINVL